MDHFPLHSWLPKPESQHAKISPLCVQGQGTSDMPIHNFCNSSHANHMYTAYAGIWDVKGIAPAGGHCLRGTRDPRSVKRCLSTRCRGVLKPQAPIGVSGQTQAAARGALAVADSAPSIPCKRIRSNSSDSSRCHHNSIAWAKPFPPHMGTQLKLVVEIVMASNCLGERQIR